jgi:hypothetical protein
MESRMTPFRGLRPINSAPIARRRLQILLEHDRRSITRTDVITLPQEEVFNGGNTMDGMQSDKSAPTKVMKAVENEKRDLARPNGPHMADAVGLCSDVLQAGAKSIGEIERLMAELHAAREYLKSEGERIRRDAARYAHLTQSASNSVKMISESMEKWRETGLPISG